MSLLELRSTIRDCYGLTLTVPIPDEEKKLSQIFIFTLLYGASKALKAFIKPFEAPQSGKTKI